MSLNKRKTVNIIIIICFIVVGIGFIVDTNFIGAGITLATGGAFLGGYKLFEKFIVKK
ncbi:MAG: hypothetical protein ACRC57_12475 [Sarcina sp.]